jgi:hypothetical protein
MHTSNASTRTYRASQEGQSYGLPYQEFDEEPTPYSYDGGYVEGEAPLNLSQAGGSHGAIQTPCPQVVPDLQKKQKLGEKTIYEKMRSSFIDTDEEILNKIKRPLLQNNADPEDAQSNCICQETYVDEKTDCCCRRASWFG